MASNSYEVSVNSTLVTKKIHVDYNTGEVKKMRKQYTTEEKQNLVAMFKNGTQTTTAFAHTCRDKP